MLGYKPD